MIRDDDVPSVALAVYAHPDDPEVSCGGTLVRWARLGAQVHLALVNRGDKGSSDPTQDPEVLGAQRAVEVQAAAEVMGIASVTMLGYPDGESVNDLELRGRLVELLRSLRPDAVVCPDPTALLFGDGYVNHRDHRVAGEAVLDAVAPAAGSPLYFPQRGAAHAVRTVYLSGTLLADVWIDIAASVDAKGAALGCHVSQLGGAGEWVHDLVEQRAAEAGRAAGVNFAEVFRRLRLGE
ncbi:MAG: putative LmbE-like protein [Acidimicrobiia bacterium]|nr:putative LmbE-like protein [Acidimicrobiia bacterium]